MINKLAEIIATIDGERSRFPAKYASTIAQWLNTIMALKREAESLDKKINKLTAENERLRAESWEDGEQIRYFRSCLCEALSLSTSEADGAYAAWKTGQQP